jgi:hypothetical protein
METPKTLKAEVPMLTQGGVSPWPYLQFHTPAQNAPKAKGEKLATAPKVVCLPVASNLTDR